MNRFPDVLLRRDGHHLLVGLLPHATCPRCSALDALIAASVSSRQRWRTIQTAREESCSHVLRVCLQ